MAWSPVKEMQTSCILLGWWRQRKERLLSFLWVEVGTKLFFWPMLTSAKRQQVKQWSTVPLCSVQCECNKMRSMSDRKAVVDGQEANITLVRIVEKVDRNDGDER